MTDYCSFFPDGIPFTKCYWGDCCEEHDDNFEFGSMGFAESNDYLWWCVRRKGYKKLANLMYYGVTLFGWPIWYYWRSKD